jgi:hypothetical protein
MPALDPARARDLLLRVVQKSYAEGHSPLPGAFVKAQMLVEAQQDGALFNERELGFKRFIEFVRTIPEIAIQGRSDLPRLRRDFWRAFIEFPVENTVRLYDPGEDKILYEEATIQRQGVLIEPVPRDAQLQWRVTFAEEQPETIKKSLLAALQGVGSAVFNEFARRLRENPSVMRAWNRYLQKQITDYVATWASANEIPEERCGSTGDSSSGFDLRCCAFEAAEY